MVTFNFYNPTRIVFGSGKLNTLSEQVLPGKKAMLLISNGKSTKVNGSLDKVKEQLAKAGAHYAVFDKIMENPVKEVIMEGVAFARENGATLSSRSAAALFSILPRQSRQWRPTPAICGTM